MKLIELNDLPIQLIDGDRGVNYPSKSEFSKNGYCAFLNTGNVSKTGFDFSNIEFINKERDLLLRKGKLQYNDIVLTTRGTIGNVGFYNPKILYEHIRINSGMIIMRCDESLINPYYLYLFLRSELFQKQVLSQGSGSAQPQLPIGSLKNISFPFTNISNQQKIVKVLSNIDAKIELNNKINSELEAMAKTLYDYWFVQFDFPFDFAQDKPVNSSLSHRAESRCEKPYKASGGKMVWNEELKREIPEGWKVFNINEIVEVKDGTHDSPKPKAEGFPLITSKNLKLEGLDFENANLISKEDYSSINKRSKVETGDILFSMIGNIGTIYKIEEKEINFAIKNVALYKTSQTENYKNFIYMFLKSIDMNRYMKNVISGSIQKFIGLTSLRNTPVFINDELIKKYNEITYPIFIKLENSKLENQQLSSLRDWLLPMLMNGQVRVGDVEEELGMVAESGSEYESLK